MGNGKIQSQRLRQSEKRSAKLYGNLQSMIQNLVQHRQEKILWNIFFLKTGRASVSILHQQELYYSGLPEKRQDMRKGYAVPASAFEEQEDGTYQAQISGAMGHAWCQVWCLMTDTGKMLK